MTDEKRGRSRPAGFDQGRLLESVEETAQMIAAWFEEVDYQNYAGAYRKLALSGTTGTLEALAKQQVGRSTTSGDPVDVASFLADAWLSSVTNAWVATRDISQEFVDDLSRYLGLDVRSKPQRAAAKKTTKGTAKKVAKKVAKKSAATGAKKTAKKTAGTASPRT